MQYRSFLLLVGAAAPLAAVAQDYCNCQYDVQVDLEPDCRVYGQIGNGTLIPWYRASQTCLDDSNIKFSAIDSDTLWKLCPFANFTNANIQLIMNEIRFNPAPATRAIQAFYPQFWAESNVTTGNYDLVNVIVDSRSTQVDCVASSVLCWGTIRDYFTATPAATGTVCQEFHARYAAGKELEQSTVRIRLCADGSDASPASCEPLQSQVAAVKAANPTKACSALGLGPAAQASDIPQCKSGQDVQNTTKASAASATYHQRVAAMGMLAAMVSLL